MSYFDAYKKRLQASGESKEDVVTQSTISIINSTFNDSPSYTNINLNGVNVGVRLTHTKRSNEKTILLRPKSTTNLGDLILFNGEKWLVAENVNHEVYPKATLRRCNESFKWKDASGTIYEYNCFIDTSTKLEINSSNDVGMNTLNGTMIANVPYNAVTKNIQAKQRFILGSQVFEVEGINDLTKVTNGVGLIVFTLCVTTKQVSDDFTNKIADNSHLIKGSTGGGSNPW